MSRLKRIIKRLPQYAAVQLLYKVSPLISDELYLKLMFRVKLGYSLNLKNPRSFNEKLQWIKLYDRRPLMTQMVDKYEAKFYVREKVGEEYVVENYGIWESFDEIDFNKLPNQFVLKSTHDQGGVVICKDKSNWDIDAARKKLEKHLKIKHYYLTREWPYKNVKPRILAEKFLINTLTNENFRDYKFYCFNGEPKLMYISQKNAQGKLMLDYYDMDFNWQEMRRPYINNSQTPNEKPKHFELMKQLSRKLSEGFPHIRVDFYEINNKLYVGELTFFQGGGLMPFIPQKWDYILGEWIDLEKLKLNVSK